MEGLHSQVMEQCNAVLIKAQQKNYKEGDLELTRRQKEKAALAKDTHQQLQIQNLESRTTESRDLEQKRAKILNSIEKIEVQSLVHRKASELAEERKKSLASQLEI